jgi:gluconolactonase
MDFEVLAEGLRFPEGPVAMADGSVVLVEIERGTLTRVWDGRSEVIAELGGGVVAGGAPPEPGRIERVDLSTGRFERLYEKVGDELLSAPNDLVFDREGNIWFTDLGKTRGRTKDLSGVYYASSDGASISEISFGATGYNGIGLSPDEKTVYAAETYTGRLIAFDLEAPGKVVKGGRGGRVVGAGPGRTLYDSLALQANGDVCIASIRDGITVMRPDGEIRILPIDDRITTNICFGGDDMRDAYITLSGSGRLIHARWPEPGLKLNFNA